MADEQHFKENLVPLTQIFTYFYVFFTQIDGLLRVCTQIYTLLRVFYFFLRNTFLKILTDFEILPKKPPLNTKYAKNQQNTQKCDNWSKNHKIVIFLVF